MRNTRVVGQTNQLKLFVDGASETMTVFYVCPAGSCVELVNHFLLECGVTEECHRMKCSDKQYRNLLRLEPEVLWSLIQKQSGDHRYQFGLFYTDRAVDKPKEVSYSSLLVPSKRKYRRRVRRPGIIAKLLEIPSMMRGINVPAPVAQPKA
jgi:hypothetical protein